MAKLKFKKEKDKAKKEIEVSNGTNLRKAMMTNGIEVYEGMAKKFNCGGKARCGTCRVHIVEGADNAGPKTFMEKFRLAFSWFNIGNEDTVRLSCQATVNGDMTIEERPGFNWTGDGRRIVAARAGHYPENQPS